MIDMRSDVQKERLELQTILDRPGFNETAFVDRGKKWQHACTNLVAERMKVRICVIRLPNPLAGT
jgi:hypothetical protein